MWEYASGLRYVFSDPYWSDDYGVFSPSALAFSASADADADDYIAQDERLAREMPDASQYAPPTQVPLAIQTTAFRGASGGTDLVVASGVTVGSGSGPAVALRDAVRIGTYVLRGGTPEAEREAEVASLSPIVRLPSSSVWTMATTLATQPGEVEAVVEVASEDDATAGWARETVRVPSFGGGFQLSGLLLAYAVDEGRAPRLGEIARGDAVLQPAPSGTFASGDPVGVYAEVYGLRTSGGLARYTVEATLVPQDGRSGIVRAIGGLFGRGRRRGVAVTVEGTSPTPEAAIPLLLDASGQPPGAYTLTLAVTDSASGETVEASREVTLE